MNQYLLLRDNKQTGPYSKDELVAKGLKAYDLVWLEGRSAAWRYPSEIDELKPFAPVVEEQPYDRFFKKPSEQTSTDHHNTEDTTAAISKTDSRPSAPEIKQQEPVQETVNTPPAIPAAGAYNEEKPAAKEVTGRHIYVNMPAASGAATQPVNGRTTTTVPAAASTPMAIPEEQSPYAPRVSDTATARPAETKLPGNNTLNERFSETASTASWSERAAGHYAEQEKEKELDALPVFPKNNRRKLVTGSLVAACLVLGGVAIGLFISYNRQQAKTSDLEQLVKQIYEREQAKKQEDLTRQASVIQPVDDSRPPAEDISEPPPPPLQEDAAITGRTTAKPPAVKKPAAPVITGNDQPVAEEDNEAVTMNDNRPAERKSQTRENSTYQDAAIQAARKNIYQMVEVAPNEYKTGLLGGISNLNMTLSNNSGYPLDQVAVEIKYLGPEKKVVKTQTIVFNDIAPGAQKTLEAPRTNRGVTIDYTITHINSRILGLAQVGL